MLPDAELAELGVDILNHGLITPVTVWQDPATGLTFLLDGRNRLEAMERSGVTLLPDATVRFPDGQTYQIVDLKEMHESAVPL